MDGVRHIILLALLTTVFGGGPSNFPCPGPKAPHAKGVSCQVIKLPPNLCASCPLKAPLQNGQFKDCAAIYDTKKGSCLPAMRQYAKANPCDPVRNQAIKDIDAGKNLNKAYGFLDYFLYSVCEQCCDCIPIGASGANLGAWFTTRGNCPAHAYYDICKVAPKFKYFIKTGQSAPGNLGSLPFACNELNKWANSPNFNNWLRNPKTSISNPLSNALGSVLHATSCSSQSIWNKCFNLESKQNNLGKPGTIGGVKSGNVPFGGSGKPSTQQPDTNTPNPPTNNNNPSPPSGGGGNCKCPGVVKMGCLGWNSATQSCQGFGQKCFPDPNSNNGYAFPPKNCGDGGGSTSGSNGGNNGGSNGGSTGGGGTTGGGNTSGGGGNTSGGGGKPSNAKLCACTGGTIKFGCLDWNSAAQKCNAHGKKCVLPGGPSYGYSLPSCCQNGNNC